MGLTFRRADGTVGIAGMHEGNEKKKLVEAVRRLAAYEETGLEPEQVAMLKVQAHKDDGQLSPEEVWEIMETVCDGKCAGCPIAELNDPERGRCPWGSSYQDIRNTCREIRILMKSE